MDKKLAVVLGTCLCLFVLVYLGKLPWADAKEMLMVLLPSYVGAQGIETAAMHFGAAQTFKAQKMGDGLNDILQMLTNHFLAKAPPVNPQSPLSEPLNVPPAPVTAPDLTQTEKK